MDALLDIPDTDMELLKPAWGSAGRAFTLGMVAGVAKVVLTWLNTTHVSGQQAWMDAVYNRPAGVGLITISNHTSMFDDPGLLCALTPWSFFWTEPWHKGNRWTLCAKEVCFKNELLRQFFTNGKTIPVARGQGVDQPAMRLAASQLSKGGWVQVFPEGRIVYTGQLGPFKWGVGKIICDARLANGDRDPVVLPFFHSGMGRIMPKHSVIPRPGNQLHISVGQPLDISDITCDCNKPGKDQQQVWKRITLKMREALEELERSCPPNIHQVPDKKVVAEGVSEANAAPA